MGSTNYLDSEKAVIGAVLLSSDIFDEISLDAEDFAEPKNSRLWQTMAEMRKNSEPIDLITLSSKYPERAVEFSELLSYVPTAEAAPYYAAQVSENATKRRILAMAQKLIQDSATEDSEQLLSTIKTASDSLTKSGGSIGWISSIYDDVMDELSKPSKVLKSPYKKLNQVIGGYRSGGMYVIAARPGVGKTMFALQNAFDLAEGGGVMFFSLEMSRGELVKRLMASQASVFAENIAGAALGERDFQAIAAKRPEFQRKLVIEDQAGLNVNKIRAAYRRANRETPINALVIDYLGLMSDVKKSGSRYEKVTNISNDLKQLARELEIPIIALHQLNREVESRQDPRPGLADLRDSGAIEQDADVVMLMHREHDLNGAMKDILFMYVAKNRHGKQGLLRFKVEDEFVRVTELLENY
jgi:replicative DNA helicase